MFITAAGLIELEGFPTIASLVFHLKPDFI
jgi:hypothetical protein